MNAEDFKGDPADRELYERLLVERNGPVTKLLAERDPVPEERDGPDPEAPSAWRNSQKPKPTNVEGTQQNDRQAGTPARAGNANAAHSGSGVVRIVRLLVPAARHLPLQQPLMRTLLRLASPTRWPHCRWHSSPSLPGRSSSSAAARPSSPAILACALTARAILHAQRSATRPPAPNRPGDRSCARRDPP
jgi:hypothetical protein